jgi:hypothetical protein
MDKLVRGDKVKRSAYALRPEWEYYLGLGDYTRKNAAKRAHDRKAAQQGTVIKVEGSKVEVRWADGTMSQCLDYMVEDAEGF